MSYPFEVESPNQGRHIGWIGYMSAALAGWAALEITFAVFVFVVPHGSHFAPEIGPVGSFIIFSLAYTVGYIPLFIALAVAWKLVITKAENNLTMKLLPLLSGAVFALVSGGFECLNSGRNAAPLVAIFFAVAGVVCMAVMQSSAS